MEQLLREYGKTAFRIALYCVTLFAVSGLNLLPETVVPHDAVLLVQYGVYCLLISAWMLSSAARLCHPRIRLLHGILCAVFFLNLFFSCMRQIVFAGVYPWQNIFWYLFYLPTIAIPLLSFYMTQYVGRDETWHMPAGLWLMAVPGLVLLTGILTNEWHEKAFILEEKGIAMPPDGNYRVTWLYFLAQGWYMLFTLLALMRLFRVSRENDLRVSVLPQTAVIICGVVYTGLYALDRSPEGFGYLDPTIASCTITIGVWEACFQTGMIPNNRGHAMFFGASTVPMVISDRNKTVRFVSAGSGRTGRVWLTRTAAFPEGEIRYGEDVTELTDTNRALMKAEEEMREANRRLAADARIRVNLARSSERVRLYIRALADTRERIEYVRRGAKEGQEETKEAALSGETREKAGAFPGTDAADPRERIARLTVPLAYVKRRVNLVLTEETGDMMPVSELHFCLRESVEALSLIPVGVVYTQEADAELRVPARVIERLYDAFEDAVEGALSRLEKMRIRLETEADKVRILLVMEGSGMERRELVLGGEDL